MEVVEDNCNLREAVLREFEQFKNQVTAKYKEGYSIISNPAYMVTDAHNRMGGGNSYEQSISILKQAASLDPDFSFYRIQSGICYSQVRGKGMRQGR